MRANALIKAALALATFSLATGPLLALQKSHHKSRTHKVLTHAPAPKHPAAKPAPKPKRSLHRHDATHDTVPSAITRIRAHARSRRSSPARRISAPARAVVNARPSDFLAAAAKTHATMQAEPSDSVLTAIRPTAEGSALPPLEDEASTPIMLPLYDKRGRLIVPRALRGSHEILVRQNEMADSEGLDRVRDDDDLLDLRSQNLLVPIPEGRALTVDQRLPEDRRYCRPWTARFLATMAGAYYARFHTPLQVNSAVRTVAIQQHLLRTNSNAAPIEGDTASPHLTGQAVDLAKHGLTLTQIAWLRGYLLPLVQQGKLDVEEEFKQACFHISVYKRYLPPASVPRRSVAATHHSETTTLATAVN